MNKNLNKTSYLGFLTLLTLSFLVLFLFLKVDCNKATEDSSLVTGKCKFTEIHTNFSPNPVTIVAGETVEVEVEVVVSSNCTNYVEEIYVCYLDDLEYCPPDDAACFMNNLVTNGGTGNMTVSISSDEQPGRLQLQYTICVSSKAKYTGTTKRAITILEVDVVGMADFSLYIPAPLEMLEGTSVSAGMINVTRTGGHDESIDLSIINMPADVSYSFDPNPVPGNEDISQWTFTADYTAVPGEYTPTVIANDDTNEKVYEFDFSVRDQYTISADPTSLSIAQGQSNMVNVNIDFLFSEVYNEMVFTVEGGIIGQGANSVDTSFSLNPLPWGTFSTELTFTVGESVTPGTYPITIKGATTNLEKSTVLQLTVTQ